MLAYRSANSSYFIFPQVRVELRLLAGFIWAKLKKTSISRWQFVVCFFLVMSLSFSSARLFWLLLPYPVIPAAVVAPVAKVEAGAKIQTINIDQLKSFFAFGKPVEAKQNIIPVLEVPSTETQLSLLLMGVIESNYDQLARAFISVNNKQDIYAIGASLPAGEGVSLAKVMKDGVVINNKGTFEMLYFDQNVPHPTPHYAASTTTISPQAMADWEADHAESEEPEKSQRPTVTFPDQAITALSRSVSNAVALNTYNESGKMVGFKLSPGRDADKFKALGLQANDVVIAINDWPVNSPEKVLALYQNLGERNSATLHIKRGAFVVTVDVTMQ